MGKKIPKMLLPVRGRPLLYWALKSLERSPVDGILLAVPAQWRREFERKLKGWKFRKVLGLVNGGAERTDSTRNAVAALPSACEWVGIHDGARAFVTPREVKACFEGARKTGGAILAVPSKDTVKVAAPGGRIERTIPRERCWAAQTPQVFRRDIAQKLHAQPRGKGFTDDASIAEKLGYKVAIVPGSYENLKVTTPEDLAIAEIILKRRGLK